LIQHLLFQLIGYYVVQQHKFVFFWYHISISFMEISVIDWHSWKGSTLLE